MSSFLTAPARAYRDTPVTSAFITAIGVFGFWLGITILTVTVHLPPARQVGYAGPMALLPLQAWGWAFIVVGVLAVARLFAHDHHHLDLGLHLLKMSVVFAWALTFDLGAPTTGQPAYTFVALTSFATAFIPAVVEKRYGHRRPQLPPR